MDALLGYLREKLKELEIYQKLNLIVLSDHGMSSVSKDKLINLRINKLEIGDLIYDSYLLLNLLLLL